MRLDRPAVALGLALLSACASAALKPPSLRVEGLRVDKLGITGAALDVKFRIQNPNPEPMLIERFQYELILNGHRMGRGYEADPVELEGFRDARVVSRFDVNLLSLPGTIKAILDEDRARARVEGTFYVREGRRLKHVPFDVDAEVDLAR